MVGFWLFTIIVTAVVITHFWTKFTGYDFAATNPALKNLPPSWEFPFGTDKFGRNTVIRVLEGGWISLQVGFLSTIMAVTIGVTMGAIAGYFGGKIDIVIMRVVEVIYSFPFLALAYIITAIFRDKPAEFRLFVIVAILGFIRWTGLARLVRGQILSLREQEFILATKALGIKTRNQIMKHLIPNVLAMVVVSATLTFAVAILNEAFLSFLQLSVTEPIPTWGALLAKAAANSTSLRKFWWIWVFPGTMLFLFIMSINLIGEGLRDAIDPKAEYTTKKQRKANKEARKAEKKAAKGGV
jgi:peptide/nickel transport system permease protein